MNDPLGLSGLQSRNGPDASHQRRKPACHQPTAKHEAEEHRRWRFYEPAKTPAIEDRPLAL